ncbi:hypothetical protein RCL1_000022 [Eukaryota sp. TZLM3-RCL]
MGTRGLVRLIYRNRHFATHLSCDGYPSAAGREIAERLNKLLKKFTLQEVRSKVENMTAVECETDYSGGHIPLDEWIEKGKWCQAFCEDAEYEYVISLDTQKVFVIE